LGNWQTAMNYANDILSEKIPACNYVKLACQRFIDDLNNPLYYYNSNEVDTVITFINALDLTEQSTPKKFILEPWQTFIIANLYGIYNAETNLKKYRSAFIEVPRKQGKSQLITALSLFHLLLDTDAQVVISANSREQAKNVDFKKVKQFALQLDNQQKHIKQYFNKVTFGTNELIVTSSDASRLDGLNASFVLIDEFHEAKDNKVYNVLKSSQGSRSEPLFVIITTAGFNTDSFCYSLRNYCISILDGTKEDSTQFSLIYTLDENDNFDDPDVWIKANPNLNVSIYPQFLQSEVNKAKNNNSEKSGVLTKNFNVWMQSNQLENWIEESYIIDSFSKISINNPKFKDIPIYCGVDLASVSDIAAVSYMLQLDDKLYFWNNYYINEETFNKSPNSELYKQAHLANELIITSGNVTDFDFILDDILKINQNNPIQTLSYDKWNSVQFAIDATQAGLYLQPFSQMAGSLNRPIKELERLTKSGKVIFHKNSLTKWMFNNIKIKINAIGNYSIDKSNRNKKIDGIAAMLNALGVYLESPQAGLNVW
jgi:phage terminase large subunit-like protein